MLRVFIGIELSAEVQANLARTIDRLHGDMPKVRWVREGNLHITLKFIGNVVPYELPDIFSATASCAVACSPFLLEIRGLGCFPDLRRPRVVWAGCGVGSNECVSFARKIEMEFARIGYKPEHRPFRPHVTMGRIRTPKHVVGLDHALQAAGSDTYGQTDVSQLVVFMSELKSTGAEYAVMQRVDLNGSENNLQA